MLKKKSKLWKRSGGYTSKCWEGTFLQRKWHNKRAVWGKSSFLKLYIFHNCKHKMFFNLNRHIFILCGRLRQSFKRTEVIQVFKFCSHNQFLPLSSQGRYKYFPDVVLALTWSVNEIRYKHCYLCFGNPIFRFSLLLLQRDWTHLMRFYQTLTETW